jgi:hypothetical protein
MKPVTLVPKPTAQDEVRESIISILRETLAEAEAGNIDTVIMLLSHPNGEWTNRSSGTNKFSEAIGRLEITKADWIKGHLGRRDDQL